MLLFNLYKLATIGFFLRVMKCINDMHDNDLPEFLNMYVDAAPPKIDRTNMRDITIKAGNHIRLDIKVSGEPPPSKTW